mmetsp:Transcript_12344/g.18414  ORF Transcript_12344/g.18414 Transcript_12344/m.18414 type:complete len:289 (-) Transcript_12344:121-987(-)
MLYYFSDGLILNCEIEPDAELGAIPHTPVWSGAIPRWTMAAMRPLMRMFAIRNTFSRKKKHFKLQKMANTLNLPTQKRLFTIDSKANRVGPNASDENSEEAVTTYLRKFFLRVHPDILTNHNDASEEKVASNVDNIARFNDLLDRLRAFEKVEGLEDPSDNKIPDFPEKGEYSFYVKDGQAGTKLNCVTVLFDPPKNVKPVVLLNYFYRFLARLLKLSGFHISPAVQTAWQCREIEKDPEIEIRSRITTLTDEILSYNELNNEIRQMLGLNTIPKDNSKIVYRRPDGK